MAPVLALSMPIVTDEDDTRAPDFSSDEVPPTQGYSTEEFNSEFIDDRAVETDASETSTPQRPSTNTRVLRGGGMPAFPFANEVNPEHAGYAAATRALVDSMNPGGQRGAPPLTRTPRVCIPNSSDQEQSDVVAELRAELALLRRQHTRSMGIMKRHLNDAKHDMLRIQGELVMLLTKLRDSWEELDGPPPSP